MLQKMKQKKTAYGQELISFFKSYIVLKNLQQSHPAQTTDIYQDTHNDIMPRTYCDVGIHNFLFFCDITRYSHDNNDLMTKQATDKVFLTSSLNGRVYTSHLLKKKMLTMWFQRNELTNSHNSRIIMMPNIAEYFNLSHQYILHHQRVLLAPYLQLVLVQDMAFHHEDGGNHMQPEHPSLFKVYRKLSNDHKP